MNVQTAAAAGGVAFGLSFLAGLFGGVPFFDIVWRALVWGAVGFGGCVGIETLLRNLVPDLFVPHSEETEPAPERNVDITLEEERPTGFVEEDGEAPPMPAAVREAEAMPESTPVEVPAAAAAASGPAPAEPQADEDMPEIGSFLDAFKPQGPATAAEAEPESAPEQPDYGDYAPSGGSSSEVTIDGEAQDPAIMAKAIQTVLKRDAQGS